MKKMLPLFAVLGGCVLAAPAPLEAQDAPPFDPPEFHLPSARVEGLPELELHETWHPRSHPMGTLLLDSSRHLWMVTGSGLRRPVNGDDTLGEIGLGFEDAIPMSDEEERCVVADRGSDYWYPEIEDWHPVFGPYEDENLYVLNWDSLERRITSPEAMQSYGLNTMWIDWFDASDEQWYMFEDEDPPFPMRDGALVRTELGLYYVVHGRSYYFWPQTLAEEAGYHTESALEMHDARLRDVAPAAFTLERWGFELCPADDTP